VEVFSIRRRIHYYETDAMAIVHHSNHLRLFEEARVAWFRERKLHNVLWAKEAMYFPLIESSVKYLKPIYFDDDIEVKVQVRLEKRRFFFQYAVYVLNEGVDERGKEELRKRGHVPFLCATGTTTHVLIDKNFTIIKNLSSQITRIMEAEPWTETWP